MTQHQNLKILTFVGLAGSGKSTAVHHFTEKGFPKISINDPDDKVVTEKAIEQVHHLAGAGQHRIVVDDIVSQEEYRILKHNFPGEMTTVAISRENSSSVAEADYAVLNDGSLEDFYKKLDSIAHEIGFS